MGFQYPRSDRRRCNENARIDVHPRHPAFSILGRIGGDATKSAAKAAGARERLSVSSVGSEAMQHGDYDRALYLLKALSVSSVGSEAMQHSQGPVVATWDSSFSILGRIGGDATV